MDQHQLAMVLTLKYLKKKYVAASDRYAQSILKGERDWHAATETHLLAGTLFVVENLVYAAERGVLTEDSIKNGPSDPSIMLLEIENRRLRELLLSR